MCSFEWIYGVLKSDLCGQTVRILCRKTRDYQLQMQHKSVRRQGNGRRLCSSESSFIKHRILKRLSVCKAESLLLMAELQVQLSIMDF